jgi:glc operon protein GlcG
MSGLAQSTTTKITFIDSNKVAAAFAKGMPLLENSQFKVHAGRRDAPGIPEIHTRDTDIFYILEGAAVFVTGGTAVDAKPIAPDELRAKEIKGGESRRISKGDVITIPNGVPHWFKQVDAPLLYYVVKVSK